MSGTMMQLGALAALAAMAGAAQGAVTVTLGASAPTYNDRALTFDEPGTPTGPVSANTWLGSHDVVIDAGDGQPIVDDFGPVFGSWAGTGNSFFGNFGVFMTFAINDVTGLSMQVWDPSGVPSPFGGGMGVFVFNDGVQVADGFFTPAWGGVGDTWLNVSAMPGESFDEVRVLGFGFGPTTIADNLSWDVVPAPSALALLGVSGLLGLRRRAR